MRKGISQVISSTLMIAIAVSIAGLYAQWAPDFSQGTTGQVADSINQDIACRNAAVDLKKPVYDQSGQRTTVDIENTGTISFYDSVNVYALNNSQVIQEFQIADLEVGETRTLEINSSEIPNKIVTTVDTCPSLKIEETEIKITS